jgi:hypothetical protein
MRVRDGSLRLSGRSSRCSGRCVAVFGTFYIGVRDALNGVRDAVWRCSGRSMSVFGTLSTAFGTLCGGVRDVLCRCSVGVRAFRVS